MKAAFAFAIAAFALLITPAYAGNSSLYDQTKKSFTLDALRGTPVVLTFVSAHCVDACPLINAQFEAMQSQMRKTHLAVRLVTLTLDPEHDRWTDMKKIAVTFGADSHYWIVGSGTSSQMHALMHRFNVVAQRGARGYDDLHTTYVYLIDRRGHLVKTMLASTNLPADLFAELQRNWNRLDS